MTDALKRLFTAAPSTARRSGLFGTELLENRVLFDMVYPGSEPTPEEHDHEEPAAYVLGSKWSQPGGLGAPVNLTYSFSNLLDGGMGGGLSAAVLESAVEEALQVWSAVSPLRFTEIVDAGPAPADTSYPAANTPNLRFGHHFIDGGDGANTLAHAYYPSGSGLGGDLHFDNGNTWTTNPRSGIDLIEVAVHEIGHALGINHQDAAAADAIMNPMYGGRYSGPGSAFLLADDAAGIQAQYGAGLGYVVSDGTLYLSGTEAAETLKVDFSGSNFTLSRGAAVATASLVGISQVVVNGRGGNDAITVKAPTGVSVVVNGGAGADGLTLNESASAFAGAYTVAPGSVSRDATLGVTYSATESFSLEGSDLGNVFNVSTAANVPVTLSGNGGDDVIAVTATAANAGVTVRSGSGSDVVSVNADNLGAATVLFDQSDEQLDVLTLGAGGVATLAATPVAGGNVLAVQALTLAPTGKLDLKNGGMIVDAPSATVATTLTALLASGRGSSGAWTSAGVSSSAVGTTGRHDLAMATSADVFGLSGSESATWLGRTVDASSVLVRFTYAGDADLNGKLDSDDYFAIDSNFNLSGKVFGYARGDFNYDGAIDSDDYFIIDSNFNAQGAPLMA